MTNESLAVRLSKMDSIAYTNLRKEPGMEILPRWVELPRTDRHRVKRMTSQQIRALLIERKMTDSGRVWDHSKLPLHATKGWRPLERRIGRHSFRRADFGATFYDQPAIFDPAIIDNETF